MKKIGISVLAWLLTMIFAAAPLFPCAMITHQEIATRSTQWLDPATQGYVGTLIDKHRGALLAGSVFPDWGYSTGYSSESEEAHWDPFISESLQYIKDTYGPPPWSEAGEKTFVFVLGIISHSWADLSWHNLNEDGHPDDYGRVTDGFLEAIARHDFGGDFGASHDQEMGGDFIVAHALDTDWSGPGWIIPAGDMAAVYKRRGYSVSEAVIWFNAQVVLKVASDFLNLGGENIESTYEKYADVSNFFIEEFEDYFVGGLDEMAFSTYRRWERAFETLGIASSAVNAPAEATPQGTAPFTDRFARVLMAQETTAYSYFGTALAAGDFDGDWNEELIIGAPGWNEPKKPQIGRIVAFKGPHDTAVSVAAKEADTVIAGSETGARFGRALAACDLNRDGIDDIAVGAPLAGAAHRGYEGAVFVYFGHRPDGLSQNPDLIIAGTGTNDTFGWTLAAGDLDGDGHADLIVGSPHAGEGGHQRGRVDVFLSAKYAASGTLSAAGADLTLTGETDYDRFGMTLAIAKTVEGPMVIVGAPNADAEGNKNAGKVYGYRISAQGTADLRFALTGSVAEEAVGRALAVGDPLGTGTLMLAVGSPDRETGEKRSGRVSVLPLDTLSGTATVDAAVVRARFDGAVKYGRLGMTLLFADLDGDGADELIVGEPFRGDKATESGAVLIVPGGASFPATTVTDIGTAGELLIFDSAKARFGSTLSVVDSDDDGCPELAVGALGAMQTVRRGGAAFLFARENCQAEKPEHEPWPDEDEEAGENDLTDQEDMQDDEEEIEDGVAAVDETTVPDDDTVMTADEATDAPVADDGVFTAPGNGCGCSLAG